MSSRAEGLGWRFWCLLLACAALALSLTHPTLPVKKSVQRYVFVIDITQSMNARDYHLEHLPPDRLGFVKAAIGRTLRDLPCGSEVGLGLFTTQNTQLLFEPLEICEHFAVIDDALAHIDWRMAWGANSFIARGLFSALREIAARDTDIRLAFFTDGQQFPPEAEMPNFQGKPGEVRGLLVGVGGVQPVPIPRLDRDNRPQGYWQHADVKDFLPPTESVDGHARGSNYFLSRLDEQTLRGLAAFAGLRYHRLVSPEDLSAALRSPDLAVKHRVVSDIRWVLALMAIALLLSTRWTDFRKAATRADP
jgi:mxaL protein